MGLKQCMSILLAAGSTLLAASTGCPQHYWGGQAPDFVNPKLTAQTTELCYDAFGVVHSGLSRTPLWSAEHLTAVSVSAHLPREGKFHAEPRLSPDDRAEPADYARSGYDRGHMAPSADMPTPQAQQQCFTLANMVPQDHDNNTILWEGIESAVRTLARKEGELYVITGPLFEGSSLQRIGGRVLVPTALFKAVYDPVAGGGAAYVAPNRPGMEYEVVSLDRLERRSGILLFPHLSSSLKTAVLPLPAPTPHGYGQSASRHSDESPLLHEFIKLLKRLF